MFSISHFNSGNNENKFEEIYESYINGNKTWVKEQVKKMSKDKRKDIFAYVDGQTRDQQTSNFFFELI